MEKKSDRVEELLGDAKKILVSGHEPDRAALWRAYVAVEYAILDLKLRHNLEGQPPPPKPARRAAVDISAAISMLNRINPTTEDKKTLLYNLRSCRDALKALVASYDRRSTTS